MPNVELTIFVMCLLMSLESNFSIAFFVFVCLSLWITNFFHVTIFLTIFNMQFFTISGNSFKNHYNTNKYECNILYYLYTNYFLSYFTTKHEKSRNCQKVIKYVVNKLKDFSLK